MSQLESDLKKIVPLCLERRSDGRYYATEEGARKLEAFLIEKGYPPTKIIVQDGRFEIDTRFTS